VATRREKNLVQQGKTKRIDLTPTGLLMEGLYAQNPRRRVNECYHDLTSTTRKIPSFRVADDSPGTDPVFHGSPFTVAAQGPLPSGYEPNYLYRGRELFDV